MVCRSKGKSAVGKAAYIRGKKIFDQRQQKTFNFEKKQGEIAYSNIMAPSYAPAWVFNPDVLWNKVELTEKRKDAQTARELIIALPLELTLMQQISLMEEYIQENFVKAGMIADISMHNIATNPHVHVLLTTRKLASAEEFGNKDRSWNKSDILKTWRQAWKLTCNKYLKEAGILAEINDSSYSSRKIRKIPLLHIGNGKTKVERDTINNRLINLNKDLEYLELERKRSVNRISFGTTHGSAKPDAKLSSIIAKMDDLLQFVEQSLKDNEIHTNKKITELKANITNVKAVLSKRQGLSHEQSMQPDAASHVATYQAG
jgi:hypothetical protein